MVRPIFQRSYRSACQISGRELSVWDKRGLYRSQNKSIAAKAAIGALKAIPGVNLAGEVINAIVAAAIVAAIGEGSAFVFEKVCLGEMSAKDVDAIRDFKEPETGQRVRQESDEIIEDFAGNDQGKNSL